MDGDHDAVSALGAEGTEEEGFRQVFAAFKAGVEKQLGAQDYEARYDLGIAYREMGLFDDAIGEFRTALEGPKHKLQCLHMLGLCALDLGRPADAVGHLEQALAWPELPPEQQTALRFDLGRAYEAQGDLARARAAWEAVAASDPGFADVRDRLAADIAARHATVQTDGAEVLVGDRALLERVVQNLVANAVAYTPCDREPVVTISLYEVAGDSVLTVADNGDGIPPDERERVFEPFQRGVAGAARTGSGLGLAFCRKVAEQHGGDLTLTTAPGGGAAFVLRIPRVSP
jgi:tetratricopeptide (TPR) repeat protein